MAKASEFAAIPGQGVTALVDGHEIAIGNERLMTALGLDTQEVRTQRETLENSGATVIHIAVDKQMAGLMAISDQIREDAPQTIQALKNMGLNVVLLTGDTMRTAQAVAQKLGIETVVAGVLPERKAEEVQELQNKGQVVGMVGDGINDAPALAGADLGVAMGSGMDVALESGDVVLMREDLNSLLTALSLSRAVMTNIRQNLFWAFAFNTIGIPVAMGLLYLFGGPTLNPMLAGTAMAMSSVTVVTNALRLRFFNPGQ
jgi:Cu+-exporting ATPase